uniref:BED-type domain-containing protein n=1 Tax=Rhodosorus marinus TaxID=101924 RepID=A0A7S3A8E0_9RHOD|mmetsp:Transcript_5792/g.24376  ORF Transcript_5792/g.24376 Transcript_5792/m.24376 type:complete len:592 (+) Transcript_5792:57-1832(+)
MAKPGRQKSRTWDHFRPVSGTSRMRCTRCSTEVTARRDRMQKHWDGCVVQGPRESEHSLIAKPGDRRDGDPRWNQPGRKRTATWRHFKDSPDHKGKARCDKCGYELSARVDRMKKHLIVCRPELGIEIESAAKDVKPEPSPREPEQQTPQNGLERANGRRLTESDVRALNRTLGRLILRHNIHIDLLDDPELKNLWQGMVYVPPSRQSWMSVIEDLWRMEKSKSETFVRRSRRLTLVTDACREPKTPHFASFIAVNENGESVMWDMSPVSADVTVENVGEGLKMRLNRLRQLDKVIAVTTDGGIMMNSVRRALEKDPAYEGVIFGHCLVQQTRKMAKDLLIAGGDLWTKLKTVERICSQIVASSEAQEFLRTFEGYKEVEMQGVNASEWNSVLYCLIRITQNRPALKTLVRRGLSMGIGFEEKEAIADEDFWLAVEGIMPVARVFCFLQGLSESCELTSGCVAFGFYWIRRIVQASKNFTDVLRESMTEAIEERIRLALGMEAYVSWYLDPRLRGAGMKDRDVHKTCVAASDMAVRLGIFGDEDVENWKDNLFLEWHDYKDGKGSFDLSSCWSPAVTRKPERYFHKFETFH